MGSINSNHLTLSYPQYIHPNSIKLKLHQNDGQTPKLSKNESSKKFIKCIPKKIKSFKSEAMKIQKNEDTKMKKFKCKFCKYSTKIKSHLKRHTLSQHSVGGPF